MLKRIFRRNTRQPLSNIAVILFAAVLAVVMCFLHSAAEAEQKSFEQTYASVPVFFKIVDLDGSKVKAPGGIEGWVVDLFTERGLQPNLSPFVEEIHTRVSYPLVQYGSDQITVTGITSTYVAEELTAGWGGSVHWREGYDESIFKSGEFVCVVPELLQEAQEVELTFTHLIYTDKTDPLVRRFTQTFKVVGYYTDPGNSRFYIPYPTMEWIHGKQGKSKAIEGLGAILNDNYQLDALREAAGQWFAEPNPTGAQTPWGRFDYEYYLYATDIDDTVLKNLSANIKNSMRLNSLASAVIFVLSAGAGFLTGFLVIRSRKREIVLMRTMGASQLSIYLELALEQLVCIALGIAIGGGYSLWQPILQLCLFGGIYYIGLTAALILFLRIDLLSTMKEDE